MSGVSAATVPSLSQIVSWDVQQLRGMFGFPDCEDTGESVTMRVNNNVPIN